MRYIKKGRSSDQTGVVPDGHCRRMVVVGRLYNVHITRRNLRPRFRICVTSIVFIVRINGIDAAAHHRVL